MSIYFDNSASTKVSENSAKKAYEIMTEVYGNPSSLHGMGFNAQKELDNARKIMAQSLGVSEKEIYFTSGATESNNLAILGAVNALKKRGNKIVSAKTEHPSVLKVLEKLSEEGFEVELLSPDETGNISAKQIFDAVDEKTILVSLMSVNNETGAINPINAIPLAVKKANSPAFIHVDHVQGFLKVPIDVKSVDLLSISAHKFHGPKGVGLLYIKNGKKISPLILGGGQEKNLRSGTENLSSICAMAQAAKEIKTDKISDLNAYLRERLKEIDTVKINSPMGSAPHILNFSPAKIRGETVLNFLSERKIFVSTGSSCSKNKPSSVLTAMNLPIEQIQSSIRVSFCNENTKDEIDVFITELKKAVEMLAKFS